MIRHAVKPALLIATGLLSGAIHAQPSSLGPLSQYVESGSANGWNVQDDGEAAFLENRDTNGAILYYYIFSPPEDEGSRAISVDIGFGFTTNHSLAGLLYGYSEDPKSYFMVTAGGDRSIHVHRWMNGYLEQTFNMPVTGLTADSTSLLIEEQENTITISVNGSVVKSMTDEHFGRGGVGIVASDIGQFKFSNFSINRVLNTALKPEIVDDSASTAESPSYVDRPGGNTPSQPLKYFTSPDRRFNGMVSHYTPFPENWRQLKDNKDYVYEGPHGLKVSGAFGQTFQYSKHPDGVQMLQMQGQKNTPPYSLQQMIDEFFMPVATKTGRQLVRTYPLPAYAQNQGEFQSRLFKSVPVQQRTDAYALEWADEQGLSYITAITVTASEAFPISTWFMTGQYMVVETEHFTAARDAYLYGLEHSEVNPRWLQLVNQRDAQRAGQSWAAHQSRMSAIRARGEAGRSLSSIYSEISDISHAGYLKRSAIKDHGHSASVRANNETTMIADHSTGEHYVVEGNNQFHWVNSNGVYIATDNALFDPRTDDSLKMFNWTQFQNE